MNLGKERSRGFIVYCRLYNISLGNGCMVYAVIAVVNWLTILMYLLTVNKWWHIDTFMVWPIKLQMVYVLCCLLKWKCNNNSRRVYIRWNWVRSYAFKLDYFCDAMSPSILFIFNRLDRIKFDRIGNQTTVKHSNQSNFDSLLAHWLWVKCLNAIYNLQVSIHVLST